LLNLVHSLGVYLAFKLIQNLKVVFNFYYFNFRHWFFQVISSLLFSRNGPWQVHLINVTQDELKIVVNFMKNFISKAFVIIVAGLNLKLHDPFAEDSIKLAVIFLTFLNQLTILIISKSFLFFVHSAQIVHTSLLIESLLQMISGKRGSLILLLMWCPCLQKQFIFSFGQHWWCFISI